MKKMFAVLLASLMLASLPLAMAGPESGSGGRGMQQSPGQSFGYVVDQDLYDDLFIGDISIHDVLNAPQGDLVFVGTHLGDIYVGSDFIEGDATYYSSFIGRYNMTTGLVWVKPFSASSCDIIIDRISLTPMVKVAFSGETNNCAEDIELKVGNATTIIGNQNLLLGFFDSNGQILWLSATPTTPVVAGMDTDSQGSMYIAGYFNDSFSYSNMSFSKVTASNEGGFIFSVDSNGNPRWHKAFQSNRGGYGEHTDVETITVEKNGTVLIAGDFCRTTTSSNCKLQIDDISIANSDTAGNGYYLASFDGGGGILHLEYFGANGNEMIQSIQFLRNGSYVLVGSFVSGISLGGSTLAGDGVFIQVREVDHSDRFHKLFSTSSIITTLELAANDTFLMIGDTEIVNPFDGSPIIGGTETVLFMVRMKSDGEWMDAVQIEGVANNGARLSWDHRQNITLSNSDGFWILGEDMDGDGFAWRNDDLPFEITQTSDLDGDGYGDNLIGFQPDACPTTRGTSTINEYGCKDFDKDGWSDNGDAFSHNRFSWSDFDEDGYADQGSIDDDVDDCPQESGSSDEDRHGCLDSDGDGWSDAQEEWTTDDGADAFPDDDSQWEDYDEDGYGDNPNGWQSDGCAKEFGSSDEDQFGCPDFDGDGWSDRGDDLPADSTQHLDVDRDGYGDDQSGENPDKFPTDNSQWSDEDGDGYGDNIRGNNPDKFPEDETQWFDSDNDGMGDNPGGNNPDAFIFNPTQWLDSDGDGWGDNRSGLQADAFPSDASQWMDIDGDGCGDNPNGTNPDEFPRDFSQCTDYDGDGWGDNIHGSMADLFPLDGSEWADEDGDGIGDNSDLYLNDFDNDGYNDSIDPLPMKANPGDFDSDGCLDEEDDFPTDPKECKDSDGDGEGDNADTDDDNDGWADTDELRMGTDPFSAKDKPVDSFEIVVPGTNIGLGAWDIMGILGGVPLALWIGTGLITRNGRTRRFEDRLFTARSEEELADISQAYEWSLMWRMIGPHQALRLERIRSNLEVKFSQVPKIVPDIDQTDMMDSTIPESSLSGIIATDGYEWLEHGDYDWYREYSHEEWTRWQ